MGWKRYSRKATSVLATSTTVSRLMLATRATITRCAWPTPGSRCQPSNPSCARELRQASVMATTTAAEQDKGHPRRRVLLVGSAALERESKGYMATSFGTGSGRTALRDERLNFARTAGPFGSVWRRRVLGR